ncbi:hypothetical protein SAMN05216229_11230 [Geopseudomonas sagittaria]|uniref:Uncharacterized protein n=1 Tax=Geopseudomonas sagittaria TaxID=1135990 RepID=A0A1I5W0U1_9GAMM|nr:hypothetical protein [Pseudomonas sagittaria]SFQ13283.1 hypothetical protein SAMN05216229_11230 [Pseudomonas sagittaria]
MQTQPQNTKACKHCNQQFTYKSAKAQFCSEAHKKAFSRARTATLDKKRKYRFATSAFTFFLASAAKRSGTVEVIPNTLDELVKLHAVYKYSLAANGYGEDDQFSLCHIFPIQHPFFIGTMHADNLVISYRNLNAKHGASVVNASSGHKIGRMTLNPKWAVSSDTSSKLVIQKIIDYLGADFTATIAVKLKLQPTTRQAVIDWLTACTDPRVPSLEVMHDPNTTTVSLTKLKSEISGKSAGGYLPEADSAVEVFMHELKRLSASRPSLCRVVELWESVMPYINPLFIDVYWSNPRKGGTKEEYADALSIVAPLQEAQFQLLHGGSVGEFLTVLDTFLAQADSASNPAETRATSTATKVVPILETDIPAEIEQSSSVLQPCNVADWVKELDAEYEAFMRGMPVYSPQALPSLGWSAAHLHMESHV